MIDFKTEAEGENSLSERCRIALEKSYGGPIPMPAPKKHRLFGRWM
jgi:hypothetical protein